MTKDTSPEAVERAMLRLGETVWHSSDEDSGPDVGISVGLGDAMLFVGEVPDQDGTWSVALYPQMGDRIAFADVTDTEQARDAIEAIACTLRALAARLAEVTAERDEARMQSLASQGQACEAHEAQLDAEAKLARARDAIKAGALLDRHPVELVNLFRETLALLDADTPAPEVSVGEAARVLLDALGDEYQPQNPHWIILIDAAVAAGPSLKAVRGSDAILAALRALAGEGE